MANQDEKLGQLLLERKLLPADKLAELMEQAKQSRTALAKLIQTEDLVYPEALAQVQAEVFNVPYVNLNETGVAQGAMTDVSRKAASTYRFVPFDQEAKHLLVAVEDPGNFQTIEAVTFIARKRNLTPKIFIASGQAIDKALGGKAEIQAEIGGALQDFGRELDAVRGQESNPADLNRFVEEAPVTKVVAVIIRHAIEGAASDIHIEPAETEVRVRYRIDGNLHTSLVLPRKVHAALISRIKILSNLKIDESRLPQDGRFSSTTDNRAFDFRVSIMPTSFGEKAALRILDKSRGAPSFEDLGLRGQPQAIFKQHLAAPHGIMLISGPTGSGKSTTLFTSLTAINKPDTNIVTLEDPVEYEVDGVNQTQVHPEIGLTFASGLRSLLRQDPDVIMVGEIRDKETAELAVHAALTGHLVLSTIHTNDAIGTVPRLVDMGIDPFLLAASLRLLAAQRLVSRLCQECKRPIDMPEATRETIKSELANVPDEYKTEDNQREPKQLFESPGCPACHEGQSVGRLAIFEVVPVTRELRAGMSDSKAYDSLNDIARTAGYVTMRQDGLLKALKGEVAYEDVMRVTAQSEEEETEATP